MKPRPPTMRERRRYILVRVIPDSVPIDTKDLFSAVFTAATSLWGDADTALMQPAVVAMEGRYAFIRCRRGTEQALEAALATVTEVAGRRVALRTIATSGTMQSLRRREKPAPAASPGGECEVDGRTYGVYRYSGGKVDLFQKSINNHNTLFFTEHDLEEI